MKRFTYMALATLPWALGCCLQARAQAAPPPNSADAIAQPPPKHDPVALDSVQVTADRFGAGLARAVYKVDRQDIEQRPMGADISQSLAKVPGLQVSTGDARGGSFSFEMYMRGLSDEQIGLTLDGIPTGDSRFNGGSPPARFIESSNVARIDVSQSSGDIGAPSRFALGGFVNFVTDDPRDAFGVTTEFGVGRYGFMRSFARVDTGESPGGWSAYLTASRQDGDIWAGRDSRSSQRDHYELKAVKYFANQGSIKARVSFNDQADNDFNIVSLDEFRRDPRSDRATDAISGIPAIDVDYGGALGGVRRDWLGYVNASFPLNEAVTLSVNPYYQTLKGESYRYQDRSRRLAGTDPRAVLGYTANGGAIRPALTTLRNSNALGGPADMRVTPRDRDRYGVTTELTWADLFPGHQLRVGGWYEHSDSSERRNFHRLRDSARGIGFDRAVPGYVEYDRRARLQTSMLYAQDQIRALEDRLKVDVGFTYHRLGYSARSPLEYAPTLNFTQASGLDLKFGAAYKFAERFEVFGGYARNFSGIPEDAFLGSTALINPRTLKPLESRNLDMGLRYVGERSVWSLQAYQVELLNGIGIVPRLGGGAVEVGEVIRGNIATEAVNTAGQRNRGAELTGFFDLGAVDLYASYSYQDARHANPRRGSERRRNLAAVGVIGGEGVRDIPRHSLFAQLDWKVTDAFGLEVNANYVGERVGGHIVRPVTFEEVDTEMLGGHVVVGLGARYTIKRERGPQVDLQLNVDNVLDEKYIGSVAGATATQPEFGLQSGGNLRTLDRYFIGSPRSWTMSVRVKF